ncbi:MAG TPA: hypothetical protein VFY13_07965, partial [Luteolibacter sp.]|nr:hypothetical protein [Luteolibacter sp.]
VGENAYPDNVSPHRRNLRRSNVYDKDPSALKTRHYGRVLPSQWPDGGHDSPTGAFRVTSGVAALPTDQDKWPLAEVPEPSPGNAPQRISDLGRFYSATELGHLHDPIMWEPVYGDLEDSPGSGVRDTGILNGTLAFGARPTMPMDRMRWPLVSATSRPSRLHGGGNTLRIGRPEHPRFDRPGLRAVQWLDLFHAGVANSSDPERRQGPLQRIEGRINLNTASRDVLRCLAAGALRQDPEICRITGWNHDTTFSFAPRSEPLRPDDAARAVPSERIADAIIARRPLISPTQLATLADETGHPVFGGPDQPGLAGVIQMSDAAAEEAFARVYNNSTVRSRNFRIWLIGQTLGGRQGQAEVLAQVRRMITVFVDPGPRDAQGVALLTKPVIRILHVQEY